MPCYNTIAYYQPAPTRETFPLATRDEERLYDVADELGVRLTITAGTVTVTDRRRRTGMAQAVLQEYGVRTVTIAAQRFGLRFQGSEQTETGSIRGTLKVGR